jgi:hypothetical protein
MLGDRVQETFEFQWDKCCDSQLPVTKKTFGLQGILALAPLHQPHKGEADNFLHQPPLLVSLHQSIINNGHSETFLKRVISAAQGRTKEKLGESYFAVVSRTR